MSMYTFILLFLNLLGISSSTKFTLVNQCTYTVWPATLSNAGTPELPGSATGFSLAPGATNIISVPGSWSGRMWARTNCNGGSTSGNFSCATGDCGTGSVVCSGSGARPPATLVEFTLNGSDGLDFYDVSLVDGYNLPLMVRPVGGSGNCTSTSCMVDLNGSCPTELRVVSEIDSNTNGVACKSACEAFGDPQYCCSGPNSTPETCKPSKYSKFFKDACPTAYSYAYDDATSTFTCDGADYVVTFCPTTTASGKSSGTESPEPSPTAIPFPPYYFINKSYSLIPSSLLRLITALIWLSLYQIFD
ncbi:unnamed protein product [Amaranthus hypochondriacus]